MSSNKWKAQCVEASKKLRMSASKTNCRPLGNATRMASRASVAERFGRNPKLQGRKSASNIGSRTILAACWHTRSRTVGCRAAASGRRALGSPPGGLVPGGRCLHGGLRTTRRACARRRSPPPPPGSDHRPRRLHDWLGPAPTPPTGRRSCRCGRKGRGSADPRTAWPQPIAGSGVVALWRGEDVSPRGSWTGRSRSCPHAYLHCRCDRSRGPSLLPRCSRLSAVLRPRRTPACLRRLSPLAYTDGLC